MHYGSGRTGDCVGTSYGICRTSAERVWAVVLSAALLVVASPLSAQTAQADTVRKGGFEGPGSSEATIAEDSRPKDPLVRIPLSFFEPWQRAKAKVEESIGLTYGISYQTMYSNASASIDGAEDSSASGIFSVTAAWTLVGRDSKNPGRLTARVDSRHVYGDYTTSPQNLAFQTGSTAPTATLFGEAPLRLMTLHWSQTMFSGRAGFVVGQLFPDDYFSHHQLMNPFSDFMGLGSSFSPSINLPNAGWGIGAGVWVADQIQLKAAITDAKGDGYGDEFWDPGDEFWDGNFFATGEVAWIPDSENSYAKRVAITGWRSDPYEGSTEGYGVALASNWTVGKWVPFLMAGWSNGGGANAVAEKTVTAGTGYRFHSRDVFGGSWSWIAPPGDLRSQYTTEIYLRIYLSDALAITPNMQWVRNPALNTDVGAMSYFQIRARFAL